MAVDLTVPQWLADKCNEWVARLSMEEWTIGMVMAMAPNGDPDTRGLAEQYADLNYGRITMRVDAEDNEEWDATLVHELLHIKHTRIDDVVQKVMRPQLGNPAGDMADIMYRGVVEPYTQSMAWSLVRAYREPVSDTVENAVAAEMEGNQ